MDIAVAHEAGLIDSFIVAAKRERWRTLLSSKRRSRVIDELNHNGSAHLEPRSAIECDEQCFRELLPELEKQASIDGVFLISDCAGLDCRMLPLTESIRQVEQQGFGTIFSIVPGRLAIWVSERPRPEYLVLVKDDADRD